MTEEARGEHREGLDPAVLAALEEALLRRALPLWQEHGWDERNGGFHDRLDASLVPVPLPGKRLLVQCRQLFVFSSAAAHAPASGFAETAHCCYRFLTERYWDERHGGWFFSVAPSGSPYDRTKDTYGHAFVLFALAHYGRIFGASEALAQAARTLDLIEAHLAAPHGGFAEAAGEDWRVIAADRRQNPHMHLLEAFLALHEATGDERYRRAAEDMVGLCERVFVDKASGTLGEYFDAAWQPHATRGEIVEPGHHFEWYWLLRRTAEIFGTAPSHVAEPLFRWAAQHGVDAAHGGVFDQLRRDGSIAAASKRLWPQTEAIRAYALRCRSVGDAADFRRLGQLAAHFLRRYVAAECGFREHFDRAGAPLTSEVYASSLYHIHLAYAELSRLAAERPQRG